MKPLAELCVADPPERRGKEEFGDNYVQPSLFMHLLKSLVPGQDLDTVLVPPFFLESRSFLEKFADPLMHVDFLEELVDTAHTPEARILSFTKFFLSTWHFKTLGPKKPYNPVLGETFACYVDGKTHRFSFISEQVSHHPAVSAFFFECKELEIEVSGEILVRAKFLGNSVKTILEGFLKAVFHGERYLVTLPTFAATGLIVGHLCLQICGDSSIRCLDTGYQTNLRWLTKPMLYGEYDHVEGEIMHGKEKKYTIDGQWSSKMFVTNVATKERSLLVDVTTLEVRPKIALDEEYQGPFESRRLWKRVTDNIRKKGGPDWDAVGREKSAIENEQRKLDVHRDPKTSKPWEHKLFHKEMDPDVGREIFLFDYRSGKPRNEDIDFIVLSRDSSAKDIRVRGFQSTEEMLKDMSSSPP